MSTSILTGDCVEVMAGMEPNSVDAVVCDPPYGLEFMGKEWDALDAGLPQEQVWKGRRGGGHVGTDDTKPSSRHHVHFGGKPQGFKRCAKCGKRAFSGTPCECEQPEWVMEYAEKAPSSAIRMQRWHEQWARAAYRVLKPGGHLLAFGGSRTYHRMACAVEDAGFEIRDQIMWLYGSGFPKSLNLHGEHEGWGTALKPAHEPIVVARKPLIGTVAANVLKHGTGALNVDGCRVGTEIPPELRAGQARLGTFERTDMVTPEREGRWPANVILDEDAGAMLDEQQEGASRFFYCPKASRKEREAGCEAHPEVVAKRTQDGGDDTRGRPTPRNRNHHPTVKPVALMRYLIRLVTPPGGTVLDPFLGSGTTLMAAALEGVDAIGIEREAEYVEIAKARVAWVESQPVQMSI